MKMLRGSAAKRASDHSGWRITNAEHRLTRLRKQFGSVIAVDGISLDFNDGE